LELSICCKCCLFENHLSENGEFLGMCINSGASFNGKILIDLSRSLTTICLIFSWKKKRKKVSPESKFLHERKVPILLFLCLVELQFWQEKDSCSKKPEKSMLKKIPIQHLICAFRIVWIVLECVFYSFAPSLLTSGRAISSDFT